MAKKKESVSRIEEAQKEYNSLLVKYAITKDEKLKQKIADLRADIDFFNYGITK